MGEPDHSPKRHLAALASWALSRTERRNFSRAFSRYTETSRRMRFVAEEIVERAEMLVLQENRRCPRTQWSDREVQAFNQWLERIMQLRQAEIAALNRGQSELGAYLEDFARSARFRSAEALAKALGLDVAPLSDAANER